MPPPHHRHPAAGQGSLEYVALLSLVGAVLAAAGPAAGLPAVGTAVVKTVRTGVCIVAGDVCRPADAEAAGLSPCTLSERRRGRGGAVTIVSISLGERHDWTLARRSDGSVVVTRGERDEAGLSGGLGLEAGPLRVGVDGGLAFTVVTGTAWELPDAATAGRFLADVRRGIAFEPARWPPAWRSGDAGLAADGWAGLGVQLGGLDGIGAGVVGVEASAESAAGVRVGRGRTTLYLRSELEGPQVSDPFGETAGVGRTGPVMVEYTRDRGGPRELAFHAAAAGGAPGEVVEIVARLDLRDAANRAVASRLLRHRAPWPGAAGDDLRAVIRHTVTAGTVERSVFAVTDDSRELAVTGRLGLELGIELERTKVDRRLVEATAWTQGSPARERADCVA